MHRTLTARIIRHGGGRVPVVAISASAAAAPLGTPVDAVTTTMTTMTPLLSSPRSVVAYSATTVTNGTPSVSVGGEIIRRRYHHRPAAHRSNRSSRHNHHHSSVTTSRVSPVVVVGCGRRRHHSSAKSMASASTTVGVGVAGGGGATEATATSSSSSASSSPSSPSMDDHRRTILESSLDHVAEHGWTEDALAAGVASSDLPPSTIGLVAGKGSDLVSYFMDRCNDQLRKELDELSPRWDEEGLVIAERIGRSLRIRLEMVGPYVRCDRWHEAMAIGAQLLPYGNNNASRTAAQLEEMVGIVAECGCPANVRMGTVERTAIGAVYVATELHMLADSSDNFADTWKFLGDRVDELEWLANNVSSGGGVSGVVANGDLALAASAAVATSLGGAVLSLVQPAVGAGVTSALASSTLFPRMATFMQGHGEEDENGYTSGGATENSTATVTKEYFGDLPPFETDVDGGAAGPRK